MDILLDSQIKQFLNDVNQLELDQAATIKSKQYLEKSILDLKMKIKDDKEALDIATNAIEILRKVSDEAVRQAYKFLEASLNASLERMFENTTRRIALKEYTRNNQYPQLEIELTVANGKVRSLKADSGHGLAQIVSLLSILSLIVITNSRRLLVMDEIISGLSIHNREIITDILWTFTEIGFQFVVNEHGYVPRGAKVYHLEMVGDVSHVKETYIENNGVYLQGDYNDVNVDDDADTLRNVSNIIKATDKPSVNSEVAIKVPEPPKIPNMPSNSLSGLKPMEPAKTSGTSGTSRAGGASGFSSIPEPPKPLDLGFGGSGALDI